MDKYCTPKGYKDYWENCDERQAHLWTDPKELRPERWNTWLPWFDFRDKVVVDYGCGGAFVYDVIKTRVHRYVGIDIAERSLDFARKRLKDEKKCLFLKAPCELSELNADILIAQQVITHMAYAEMLNQFMESIKRSGIGQLMLEVMCHPDNDSVSFGGKSIHDACSVGKDYLAKHMKYNLVGEEKNDQYTFTKWERLPSTPPERKVEFLAEQLQDVADRAAEGITNVEQAAINELADLGSLVRRIISK